MVVTVEARRRQIKLEMGSALHRGDTARWVALSIELTKLPGQNPSRGTWPKKPS